MRWVDVNKGDENEPLVRARLVAKEIKKKGTLEASFAAMPPLLALKLLLSLACTTNLPMKEQTYSKRGRYCIQFIDVKKAHFWAKAERTLYVELPEEYKKYHGISGDVVGLLNRSMYGMRDAASLWEKLVAYVMVKKLHFRQGTS